MRIGATVLKPEKEWVSNFKILNENFFTVEANYHKCKAV